MGACGAFQAARAEVRGGMLCVRACRRAPPAVCMPKRPRIRSARAGQRPAPRHHQGEGHTAKSGRDSALARARSTVKCCQNPGQIKSEPRSDRIRTGGQMNRNPHDSKIVSVFNLFFLETAINTYVDHQGRHKLFDSETDLLYPPDEKRFRETLLKSIDDASEFLQALEQILRPLVSIPETREEQLNPCWHFSAVCVPYWFDSTRYFSRSIPTWPHIL